MPWWASSVLGALLVIVLPWIVSRWRPLTERILALGPAAKVLVPSMWIGQRRGSAFEVALARSAVAAARLLARGDGPRSGDPDG